MATFFLCYFIVLCVQALHLKHMIFAVGLFLNCLLLINVFHVHESVT